MKKAYAQRPEAVKAWLDEQYPAIKAQAKVEKGEIHWGDETALVNTDVRGRSYAPAGKTPVTFAVGGTRHKLSMIWAVTNQGKTRWMIIDDFTYEMKRSSIKFLNARLKGEDMATNNSSAPASDKSESDLLKSFLASVDGFVEAVAGQSTAVAPEGETQIVIQATGETLVAQTRKLTDFVREIGSRIGPTQRRDLDQFLRVQDGEALANRAIRASAKVVAPGGGPVTMGFFSFLTEHMHALKKILKGIIDIIFSLFEAKTPAWIDRILVIIDEILNLLASLVGGIFGLRVSQVADDLSRGEVNFLREMTALAGLEAVRSIGRVADDDARAS